MIQFAPVQDWRAKLARRAWVPFLFLVLAFLFADGAARWRSSERVTLSRAADAPVPAFDPASPTGYAFGQRRFVPVSYSADGFQWIMQVGEVVDGRGPRVHFVDWDDAPEGREAHWSSGPVWWLAALAGLDHAVAGGPLPLAVERMAPLASPLLLAVILLTFTPLVAGRFGSLGAIAFAGGLVFCGPVYGMFAVGYVDHHGIAAVCAALGVLFLAGGGGGWVRGSPGGPRRWFVAAGFAGGAGLWISAATETPVLVGIGVGALAGSIWTRAGDASDEPWRPDPALWRWWGFSGGAASLFFYLLEYFPHLPGMRLEVNHPLYALAWMGAGDVLSLACAGREPGRARLRDIARLLPGCLAVAVLPLVILLAGPRVFLPADPFLWAFHFDCLQEFRPFLARLAQSSVIALAMTIGYPVVALAVLGGLFVGKVARPEKTRLVLTAAPLVVATGMAFQQERWLGLANTLAVMAIVVALSLARGKPWMRAGFVAAGLLAHPFYWPPFFLQPPSGLPADSRTFLAARSLAANLRQRLGPETGVIVGGPVVTSEMIYFGGFRGLGTAYWENARGLRATVEILGAATDETALALIRKHGVTHVVDASWDFFSTPADRLRRGLRRTSRPVSGGFLDRLEKGSFPGWLRPVIAIAGRPNAIVYEVDFQQTPSRSLVNDARFFADMKARPNAEAALKKALDRDPDDPSALIVLACLQAARPDPAGLASTMRRLEDVLRAGPALDAADQIDLATARLAFGNNDGARTALAAALSSLDERKLRRLGGSRIVFLVDGARKWNLAFPPGLSEGLARGLVPPE